MSYALLLALCACVAIGLWPTPQGAPRGTPDKEPFLPPPEPTVTAKAGLTLLDRKGSVIDTFGPGSYASPTRPAILTAARVDLPVGFQAMLAFSDGQIVGPLVPGRYRLRDLVPRASSLTAFAVAITTAP